MRIVGRSSIRSLSHHFALLSRDARHVAQGSVRSSSAGVAELQTTTSMIPMPTATTQLLAISPLDSTLIADGSPILMFTELASRSLPRVTPLPANLILEMPRFTRPQRLRYRPDKFHGSHLADLLHRVPSPDEDVVTLEIRRDLFRSVCNSAQARIVVEIEIEKCRTVKDILRLFALCMQRPLTAHAFAFIHQPIMYAFYRVRYFASDARICGAVRLIVKRLWMAGLPTADRLVVFGLKFAARSRRLHYMKWFLAWLNEHSVPLGGRSFRAVIAKLSIAEHGPGAIRNGDWSRTDLRQVLCGVKGATGRERNAHLSTHLDRSHWQQLRPWLQILAAAGQTEILWQEWRIWQKSRQRLSLWTWMPTVVSQDAPDGMSSGDATGKTEKCRGDVLFVRALYWARAYEHAWSALQDAIAAGTMSPGQLRNLFRESTEGEEWMREAAHDSWDAERLLSAINQRWYERSLIRDIRTRLDQAKQAQPAI